jgi:hypothetical protein
VLEPLHQALGRGRWRLADSEYGDDHVLGEELEDDVVALPHQLGDPVTGRSGAPNVDRKPQRIPSRDARPACEALVEHIQAGNLPDPLASARQRRKGFVQ